VYTRARVAQSVERGTFNPKVQGSSPCPGEYFLKLMYWLKFFVIFCVKLLLSLNMKNQPKNRTSMCDFQSKKYLNVKKFKQFLMFRASVCGHFEWLYFFVA
jgi:hypothetical protein